MENAFKIEPIHFPKEKSNKITAIQMLFFRVGLNKQCGKTYFETKFWLYLISKVKFWAMQT